MAGIYAIKCDSCGRTLGMQEVFKDRDYLHWSMLPEFQAELRKLGWTGPLDQDSKTDKCPLCNAEKDL